MMLKNNRSLILICFIIFVLLVYVPILETFSDGVDFTIAGNFLGVPHPPSYPAFTLLVNLSKYFPFGCHVFRTNLLSLIISSLFLFFVVKVFKGSFFEKVMFFLILLTSKTFFLNAMIGEVYILNLFIIFLLYRFLFEEDIRFFFLSGFLSGLGMGIHHTVIFMTLFLVIYYICLKRYFKIINWSLWLFFFILGFSVYIYLPIRGNLNPLWNWGAPKNFLLFLNSFFRHDFSSKGIFRSFDTLIEQIKCFNPVYEFGYINGFFVIVCFLFYVFFKRNDLYKFIVVLIYFIGTIIVVGDDDLTFSERMETYAVFFLPAYFFMLYSVCDFIRDIKNPKSKYVSIVIVFVGVLLHVYENNIKDSNSYQKLVFPHDYGRFNLSMLPLDSVLIVQGGEKDFPIIYQQSVCRFREDIKIVKLTFLGKFWNLKESLMLGSAYITFSETPYDKFNVLKSTILYQKEVLKKRVFTNIYDEQKLPIMDWQYNGIFKELGPGSKLDKEYFLRLRGKGGDDGFLNNF